MEPIVVALFRSFRPSHPVYKILKPHVRHTLAINELGRRTLLNEGGFFDSLTSMGTAGTLKLMYEDFHTTFNYSARSFPEDLRSRGFSRVLSGGHDNLPGFLYRDYGFMLWDAFHNYIEEIIHTEYSSDAEVLNDPFLVRWANETSSPYLGNLKGFPARFRTRQQLIEVLTQFIFTATAEHASCSGQYDYYGFIPNRPLTMVKFLLHFSLIDAKWKAMPSNPHQTITWKYILSALPSRERALNQISLSYTLSIPPTYALDRSSHPRNTLKLAMYLRSFFSMGKQFYFIFFN